MSLAAGPGRGGSASSPLPNDLRLSIDAHVRYIQSLDTRKDEIEYWLTEHLRISGLYWGLTACHLLGHPEALPRQGVVEFVLSCFNFREGTTGDGGFGAAPGHDAHILCTVYAVQILTTLDAFADLEARFPGGTSRVAKFIASLQDRKTGAFRGDHWGETDTRFLYGALNALSLLHQVDLIDKDKCITYVQACANFDGGFGTSPGAESHAGQVFTCVGALAILGRLDLVDCDKLGGWLAERQQPRGGLNGRPEKLEDVCYSWWVGSSMAMIDRLHWIDGDKLADFILRCQDTDTGGFSDRPGDMVDVFHTHFSIAGLSLVGWEGVQAVDPIYFWSGRALTAPRQGLFIRAACQHKTTQGIKLYWSSHRPAVGSVVYTVPISIYHARFDVGSPIFEPSATCTSAGTSRGRLRAFCASSPRLTRPALAPPISCQRNVWPRRVFTTSHHLQFSACLPAFEASPRTIAHTNFDHIHCSYKPGSGFADSVLPRSVRSGTRANLPPFSSTERSNKRPTLHTNIDSSPSSFLAAASPHPAATTPDALEFYRQHSSPPASDTSSLNPSPAAHRSTSNPTVSRDSSNPPQQRRVGVQPKASFRDLVARFDQPNIPPGTLGTNIGSRSVSANAGSTHQSRLQHAPPQSTIPQPLLSSRPRPSRRDSETRTGILERTEHGSSTVQHSHRRQRSNSFAASPTSQLNSADQPSASQAPLFGEITHGGPHGALPGHGISSPHRRRGSENSMHQPNAMFPIQRNNSDFTDPQESWHQRSMSETPLPNFSSVHAFHNSEHDAQGSGNPVNQDETTTGSHLPSTRRHPLGQSQSHSRIPVKTSSRPSTPKSSFDHARHLSQTTPTKSQTSSPRRHGMSPAALASNGPRLRALISAPEPKKSPPLRSSRPRQQVSEISVGNSWPRAHDLFENPEDPSLVRSSENAVQGQWQEPSVFHPSPKTDSPDLRTFSERAVDNAGKLPILDNVSYDPNIPRLKLDTDDAQSAPGADGEPLTGATEFEDDSFEATETGRDMSGLASDKLGNSGMPRSVLSQVFELRRRNTHQYSMPGQFEPGLTEDDSGTIQIMLGGTPLLDKYDREWTAAPSHPTISAERSDISPAATPRSRSDHLDPNSLTPNQARDGQRSLDVRPNSAAYSIIDNILNQYLDQGSLTPQMLHEFTQQIQQIEPDLNENEGYDPEEIARATLQGLIDEMKPLRQHQHRQHQPLGIAQTKRMGLVESSTDVDGQTIPEGGSEQYQSQSEWAQRVGYQSPGDRPPIFTTGSHVNGRIEQTDPLPPPKIELPSSPRHELSLPEINTGGTLEGLVDQRIGLSPPRQQHDRAPHGPTSTLQPHDPYKRSSSTPPVPAMSHQKSDIAINGFHAHEVVLSDGRPSQSTSLGSADGRLSAEYRKDSSVTSIRPQGDTVKEEKRLNQRRMVIKELVDTEFSYSADMKILEDIYMATGKSSDAISDDDQRVLFGNMHDVVAFTMAFQDTLKRAAAPVYSRPREKRFNQPQLGPDGRGSMSTSNSSADAPNFPEPADDTRDRQTTIGNAFWQHMPKFEKVYGEYMRNHSAANERYVKIKDQRGVQAWSNECKEYAKDLTDAWDLDSLLVKPTQRMMKYHMILDSILQQTPNDHPDRDQLQGAITELKAATSRINDSKKRSDLLDQINNPRKRSDVSLGISKVLGRRQDKLRQQIGLTEAADDADFLSVNEKYGGYYLKLQVVMRDFDSYKQKSDLFMAQFNALMDTWEETMDVQDKPVHAEIESKWRRAAMTIREMTAIAWVDHEAAVQRHCIDPLLTVIKLNEKTQKLMQKRKKRVPEYAKWKTLQARGDKPDKKTQEAADQYVAFTDTLKDELPKLYQLTNTLIGKCLHNFVDIQKLWHVTWKRKLLTILDEQRVPSSMDEILEVLRSDWQAPHSDVHQLGICNGATLQQAGNFISFPSDRDSKQRSSGYSSRRTTAGSQQAPSFSSPELGQGRFSEQSSQTTLVPPGLAQRYGLPINQEEARLAPSKFSAISASGIQPQAREGHDFTHANPVRSSQPPAGRASADSFAPTQATRPSSSSTYYTVPMHGQPPTNGTAGAKANVFSSAMPMPDSPTNGTRPVTPQDGQEREEVLFVAASLFEFHINQPRQEAGFRYLTYVPGEKPGRSNKGRRVDLGEAFCKGSANASGHAGDQSQNNYHLASEISAGNFKQHLIWARRRGSPLQQPLVSSHPCFMMNLALSKHTGSRTKQCI
ncbi:hypothetical protein FH972_021260 [Carpinus fangiana]|uniref:protein geranylgeranyltransferase type II n=1 Tax=Carpinus fangiana TaxID=176857 RepID=A0A5N6KP78_9ROSI|nr:hypothetical protein FH972_021260 [Carpinus fangiana]